MRLSARNLTTRLTAAALVAVLGLPSLAPLRAQPAPNGPRRLALVIGEASYKTGRLSSAANDAGLIADTLQLIRLTGEAQRPAGLLSHGQKQWLEIGMLLMQDPKLLLLDEPVAGMTDDETMRTAELFVSLAGRHSLVVVEHDMAFVKALGGKVTVLHEGSVLAEGDLDSVQNDQRVIEVYLGR